MRLMYFMNRLNYFKNMCFCVYEILNNFSNYILFLFVQNTKKELKEEFEETPLIIALTVYFCYAVLMIYGHLRDFMRNVGLEKNRMSQEKNREVIRFHVSFSEL